MNQSLGKVVTVSSVKGGVGKTTTVAKIAARYNPNASDHPLRVCLLNADNYRIGAKDQIETYASLLGIPIESIDKDGDFAKKVNSYGVDTDVIIVDTLGCSQKDYEKIQKNDNIRVDFCVAILYTNIIYKFIQI